MAGIFRSGVTDRKCVFHDVVRLEASSVIMVEVSMITLIPAACALSTLAVSDFVFIDGEEAWRVNTEIMAV